MLIIALARLTPPPLPDFASPFSSHFSLLLSSLPPDCFQMMLSPPAFHASPITFRRCFSFRHFFSTLPDAIITPRMLTPPRCRHCTPPAAATSPRHFRLPDLRISPPPRFRRRYELPCRCLPCCRYADADAAFAITLPLIRHAAMPPLMPLTAAATPAAADADIAAYSLPPCCRC
jgi:hypothetical protein